MEADRRDDIFFGFVFILKYIIMKCDFFKLLYIYVKSRGERFLYFVFIWIYVYEERLCVILNECYSNGSDDGY